MGFKTYDPRGGSINVAYKELFEAIEEYGIEEENERTKTKIRVLPGGYSFKLNLSPGRLPVPGNRRYWPKTAAAECAWQFLGTKDPSFIMKHAPKLWEKFIEDGELKTAYGFRWRKHFGRDQLALAVSQLKENPTNRQLLVLAWDPATDGLGNPHPPKNVPCPFGFSVSRLAGKIHMTLFIRSSDVFVGLPYDIMVYAFLLDAICASCGVMPGTLQVCLAHPHLYAPHYEAFKQCLHTEEFSHWDRNVEPALPAWTIEHIEQDPEGYIEQVEILSGRVSFNPWNPKPIIIV